MDSTNLEFLIRRRGDGWVATTTPFAVTMYGDTKEAAKDRAIAAVNDLLEYRKSKRESR